MQTCAVRFSDLSSNGGRLDAQYYCAAAAIKARLDGIAHPTDRLLERCEAEALRSGRSVDEILHALALALPLDKEALALVTPASSRPSRATLDYLRRRSLRERALYCVLVSERTQVESDRHINELHEQIRTIRTHTNVATAVLRDIGAITA